MKVNPSNQTLLLASERDRLPVKAAGTSLDRALNAASSGGILKRLTIVAAEPDTSLVYVHADYAADGDETRPETGGTGDASPPALTKTPPQTAASDSPSSIVVRSSDTGGSLVLSGTIRREQTDDYGNPWTASRDSLSSSLKPTEQYARTQRILSEVHSRTHIDVRA